MNSEQPEIEPAKEKRRLWPVKLDAGGIIGLPEGVSPRDVILFLDENDQWWAENPSPEILKEIGLWQTGWKNPNPKEK